MEGRTVLRQEEVSVDMKDRTNSVNTEKTEEERRLDRLRESDRELIKIICQDFLKKKNNVYPPKTKIPGKDEDKGNKVKDNVSFDPFDNPNPSDLETFRVFLETYYNGEEFEIRYFRGSSYLEELFCCFLMNKLGLTKRKGNYKALLLEQNKRRPVCTDATKKFVYKNTLKLMKTRFRKERRLNKNRESEIAFWDFYFGDYCKNNNVNIEEVYDPLNKALVRNPKHKNITIDYLYHLKQNERFLNEFKVQMETLDNIATYARAKIDKLVKHLENKGFSAMETKFQKDKTQSCKVS